LPWEAENNMLQRVITFVKEVWVELNKVTWPTFDELKSSTAIVIVVVFILAVFTGVVDQILNWMIKMVFT
jgi:preprotein translocase subunit SecE